MADALELSSANKIRQLAGMPIEAELPKMEEPPSWDEIKESEDYKGLSYPQQLKLAQQWGEETKAYASTLPEYSPEQAAQIDEFVGTKAVDIPTDIRMAAGAAGLVKGAAAGLGALGGGALGMFTGPAAPVAVPALAIAGGVGMEKLAEKGLETFTPKALEAQKYAPTEARMGQIAPEVLTAGVGGYRLAKAGKTLFSELGARKAAEELGKAVGKGAAVGAGVGTIARAVTGGEITPGTVATDALLGALYTGLGSGVRVKGYNKNEALALNEKVQSGKATQTEYRDWNAILAEAERTGIRRDVEAAKRTTVELGGKQVFEKTELTTPEMRPLPTAALPPIRPPGLPEFGVRGATRGTPADTAEMQRRGIPSEFQESLIDLDYTPTRPTIYAIESQGGVIAPEYRKFMPGPYEAEIVKQGQIIGPRQQLPTTERLALPETGIEPVPMPKSAEESARIIEEAKGKEDILRQSAAEKQRLQDQLSEQRSVEARKKLPIEIKKAEEAAIPIEKQAAIEERIRQSGIGRKLLLEELRAGKTTIPRPMRGKTGEAGQKKQIEIKFDPKNGIGAVPYNQEVDYRGFIKSLTPNQFLENTAELKGETSASGIEKAIRNGEAIGNPFLDVLWDDQERVWRVVGHEGRNRAVAINRINPLTQIPVHFFPKGLRARDITEEMRNAPIVPEKGAKAQYTPQPIPRPMGGKQGEAGFVSTDLSKILKNYMTSAGALTDDMAETLLASKYNKAQLEYEAKFRLRDFNKALIEETGSSKMSPELNRAVREYINGQSEDISAIPPKTLEAAKRFRSFLDQGARKIITEPGLLTEKQRATVEANIGSYLSRSYQKFDDPNFTMDRLEAKDKERFARSVDFVKRQFLDRAKQEVDDAAESGRPPIEWLRQINETQSVPRERLMGEVQRIVEEGGAAEARRLGGKMEFRPESYGLSKELSGLKARKDIPEEIRYLMGEYDDPRVGFLKGALKQINLYVDQRTLNKLKDQGFQAGLFYDYPAPNTVEIAPAGSKVMSPLNGVYAAPDVANALKNFDVAFNSTIPGVTTFARINSVIKWSKTVGSIRSQARNFIFNIPIQIQNGNFDFLVGRDFGKTTSMIMADYGIGQDTQQTRQLLRRAVGFGVMNNAKFNEMEAVMKDAALDRGDIQNFVERHFYKSVAKPLSRAVDSAAGIKDFFDFMYRTGDNFHKIALWRYRVRALMDGKKMNEADAEIEAADWVNDRFATYEKLPPFLKAMRANPFLKNFISWNAERIRNSYYSIKGGIEDMKTPGMEKYGMRTIIGNILGLTISLGSQAMAAYALGWTYQKIKDLNKLAPGYQKASTLLPVGYDPKNKEVTYIDISYSDPFDIVRQPINAFMSEDALDKKLIGAIGTFFGDFLGFSIATETAAGLIKNERADGTQIVNPKASPSVKLMELAKYAGRVIEPGTISDMRQMYYAIKGEPDPFFGPRAPVPSVAGMASSAIGFRVQKLNVGDELFKKSRSFNNAMGQSTRLLTSELMARGKPNAERLQMGAEEMDRARIETFKDMRKIYNAALSWGLTESEAVSEMKRGGISRENIAAITSGKVPRYRVGRTMMKELYREVPEDFQRRMEITRELLKENE